MYENQTDRQYDHGAPGAAGEQVPGAPRRSRKPEYVALLENAPTRRLIAGQLGIRAEQLTQGGEDTTEGQRQANSDLAELLEEFIAALRKL